MTAAAWISGPGATARGAARAAASSWGPSAVVRSLRSVQVAERACAPARQAASVAGLAWGIVSSSGSVATVKPAMEMGRCRTV